MKTNTYLEDKANILNLLKVHKVLYAYPKYDLATEITITNNEVISEFGSIPIQVFKERLYYLNMDMSFLEYMDTLDKTWWMKAYVYSPSSLGGGSTLGRMHRYEYGNVKAYFKDVLFNDVGRHAAGFKYWPTQLQVGSEHRLNKLGVPATMAFINSIVNSLGVGDKYDMFNNPYTNLGIIRSMQDCDNLMIRYGATAGLCIDPFNMIIMDYFGNVVYERRHKQEATACRVMRRARTINNGGYVYKVKLAVSDIEIDTTPLFKSLFTSVGKMGTSLIPEYCLEDKGVYTLTGTEVEQDWVATEMSYMDHYSDNMAYGMWVSVLNLGRDEEGKMVMPYTCSYRNGVGLKALVDSLDPDNAYYGHRVL